MIWTVPYFFNHSKFGFSNSITVKADSPEEAIIKALAEVKDFYRPIHGDKNINRFTVKNPTLKL